MRICSASSSMEELLLLTELQKDLTRAKEEYPVAQILFTTSRIISLKFLFLIFFVLFFSAYIQNTRVFLIIFDSILMDLRNFRQKTGGILVS